MMQGIDFSSLNYIKNLEEESVEWSQIALRRDRESTKRSLIIF